MYVCHAAEAPAVLFSSDTDYTGLFPGWNCSPLEEPLPGSSLSEYLSWAKLLRLIGEITP
jgi:hypothetical protein